MGVVPLLNAFWMTLALFVLFLVGVWGSIRDGGAERREWSGEVLLGGLAVVVMFGIDSALMAYSVFLGGEPQMRGPGHLVNVPLPFVLTDGLFAACVVMAGATLVAWATCTRPSWGPLIPLITLAAIGVVLWILGWNMPMTRATSASFRIDQAGFDLWMRDAAAHGAYWHVTGFLSGWPWMWHGWVDRILAVILPAVAVTSGWVSWRAHRRRGTLDGAERGELRERLAGLGVLLLCLATIRLTWLAEERLAGIAVYREFLLSTNGELFLDWLRAGWFPILAALFGLGMATFAWFRIRPPASEEPAPGGAP